MFLFHVLWGNDYPPLQLSRWGKFPLIFLRKTKELLGMENGRSCHYICRDKASRKSLAAQGSYTSFSAITNILACFLFLPLPSSSLRHELLPSRKGGPETAALRPGRGGKSSLYSQIGRRRVQRGKGQIHGWGWNGTREGAMRAVES